MATWDQLSTAERTAVTDAAVRRQVADALVPASPDARERLRATGLRTADLTGAAALEQVPAVGELDVCPGGDPAGAAALVLQAGEEGWAAHADGPALRGGLVRRLVSPRSYRRQVDAATRALHLTTSGLGVRFPVATTREDLDVLARVGARAWPLLGLTRADVVVSALAPGTTEHLVLGAMTTGAGSPLAAPGTSTDAVVGAVDLLQATALVVASDAAAELVRALAGALDLAAGEAGRVLRTVVLVGAPTPRERAAVDDALAGAGLADAVAVGVHLPAGSRRPWVECRAGAAAGGGAGYHLMPDLEVVHTVDPASGEPDAGPARTLEPVTTSLGCGGTALLRWRTGDLVVGRVRTAGCPACGRRAPRVVGLRRGALVLPDPAGAVDLRALAGALDGLPSAPDWRVRLRASPRTGEPEAVVHLDRAGAEGAGAVGARARPARAALAAALGRAAPVVVLTQHLDEVPGQPLTDRVLVET